MTRPMEMWELTNDPSIQEFCKREIFTEDRAVDCPHQCEKCPYESRIKKAIKARLEQRDMESLARCHEEQARTLENKAMDLIISISDDEFKRQEASR